MIRRSSSVVVIVLVVVCVILFNRFVAHQLLQSEFVTSIQLSTFTPVRSQNVLK